MIRAREIWGFVRDIASWALGALIVFGLYRQAFPPEVNVLVAGLAGALFGFPAWKRKDDRQNGGGP